LYGFYFFIFRPERLLLQLSTLRRRRPDSNQRTLFELHVSQPDADVLPKSLPVLESHRTRLHCTEIAGPMLSDNLLPGRYVVINVKHSYINKPPSWFGCYSASTPADQLNHAEDDDDHRNRMARQLRMHDERRRILPRRGAGESSEKRFDRLLPFLCLILIISLTFDTVFNRTGTSRSQETM